MVIVLDVAGAGVGRLGEGLDGRWWGRRGAGDWGRRGCGVGGVVGRLGVLRAWPERAREKAMECEAGGLVFVVLLRCGAFVRSWFWRAIVS